MLEQSGSQDGSAERQELVRVATILYDRGLTVANDGNLSARLSDRRLLITPAGLCKGRLKPSQLVLIDEHGAVVELGEGGLGPSSETAIHVAIYANRPDVRAIIHAHSPLIAALAITDTPFPTSILPEAISEFGEIPTTRPCRVGSPEYLDAVVDEIAHHSAVVLNHHGGLVVGPDLETALISIERMEHILRVYWMAQAFGRIKVVSPEIVAEMRAVSARRAG